MKDNKLGTEPLSGGMARIEINESKMTGNSNKVYYMFDMIDRAKKMLMYISF